jgi:hypothetical protein
MTDARDRGSKTKPHKGKNPLSDERHSVAVGGASPLPPESIDPWAVKERIAVEVGQISGRRLRWRPEEIGAPHMKGFLFDPSSDE